MELKERMDKLDETYRAKKGKAAEEYEAKKRRDYKKDQEYHELLTNK